MSSDWMTGRGLGLSLSGLRVGPLDPKSKVPKVGANLQYQIEDAASSKLQQPKFMNKERSGFSGGFKIPEEQRRAKLGRKIRHDDGDDSEEHEELNKNDITKEEIMQQLNLGSAQSAGGMGKHGTGSKTALTKDLIENLEKELEKLRRTEENIKVRKHIALKGDRSILDETEEDRQRAKNQAVDDEMKAAGNNVIHADQKRIQVMRHRVGQLDSVKGVPYEELEAMRTATAERLKLLEEQYWGRMEGQELTGNIKENYKKYNKERQYGSTLDASETPALTKEFNKPASTPGASILKKGSKGSKVQHQRNADCMIEEGESLAKPKFDGRNRDRSLTEGTAASTNKGKSRSRSVKKRQASPLAYADPRQQIYEAKYEKYLANKKLKGEQETRATLGQQEHFDLYTKDRGSPSKNTRRFRTVIDPSAARYSGKFDAEDLVSPEHDAELLRQAELEQQQRHRGDPFTNLGVTGADKMTFFLLKWVFNAIKRDSADADPKFQGRPYISKSDLIKQLSKNPELMHALGYREARSLADDVKLSPTAKDGYLMWAELLSFVFLRDTPLHERPEGHDWWNQIDTQGEMLYQAKAESQTDAVDLAEGNKENQDANTAEQQRTGSPGGVGFKSAADRKPVKVTPSLQMLQATRASRTEKEVEDEFRQMAADKKASAKATTAAPRAAKKVPEYESLDADVGEGFGFTREKSKNLLLNSQIEVMREVFERLDKYNEGILRRSDFVLALRTDARVIDFIGCEALKKAYSVSTLSLDAVLLEIEKDERYDQAQASRVDQINHKEFVTWREFLNYFNDYQDIEQRNKKQSQMTQTQKLLKKDADGEEDPEAEAANEIKTLMESEKERRLQELPKLRAADQIDISEKQLQLLKDIFDSIPRATGGKDAVNVLTFFLTIRKDPQIRAINSAIARDPEGCSRVQRETFQEVFDRMERELQQKQVDWSVIVEFFTKRGRPLSKDEIQKLAEEDRREREAEQTRLRADEEAERRRNQRIMGDLEEEEDYEAFELRQKAAQAVADHDAEDFDKQHGGRSRGDEYSDDDDLQRADERDGSQAALDVEYFCPDGGHEVEEQFRSKTAMIICDKCEKFIEEDSYFHCETDDENYHQGCTDQQTTGASELAEDLTKTKLTQQDYAARAAAAKATKGKYGVTVPKPFGFDMRDKGKNKTIRERKVEAMVQERRLEEDALVKHQFRSKPIPPEVLIPRYANIQEADLARRQAVRAQSVHITRQREAPFKFWEAEKQRIAKKVADIAAAESAGLDRPAFRANPIPRACSVLIFAKKTEQDELKRGERIRKAAEMAYAKAAMPPTMQKHADKKKQEPPKKLDIEYTFKPDIGPPVTGEMLAARAERFQRDLAKKKGQKTQTQARSPKWAARNTSKVLDRPYINEGAQSSADQMAQAQKQLAAAARSQAAPQVNPSSTNAMNLSQAKRRTEILEKRKQEEAGRKADADRIARQQKLAGSVQGTLKSMFGQSSDSIIKQKAAEKRRDGRDAEKKANAVIKEAVDKGRSRPMLFQQGSTDHAAAGNLAYVKATRKMLTMLQAAGEKHPESLLSADDRARLEDEELKMKMAEMYKGRGK